MFRSILMYLMYLSMSFLSVTFSSPIMADPQTVGYALSFQTSKYAKIPNSESLNPTQLTIECWVKFNSFFESTSQHYLIDKNGEEAIKGYYRLIEYQLNGTRMYFEIRDQNADPSAENTYVKCDTLKIVSDLWYHVAGTYDGDILRLYINGNMIAQKQVGAIVLGNSQPLKIGMVSGSMDEVRIWSAARTQAEIQSTMYREIDSAPGLVSAWHFNESTGQVVTDATGVNNGYLGSTPDADSNDPIRVKSTAPVSGFLVLSPNGGEDWETGSVQPIRWFAYNTAKINIEYSYNAGFAWNKVADQVDASSGTYIWTVPEQSTTQGLIRITDSSNPDRTDKSDATLSISPTSLQLLSPNGGENWETETYHSIIWKSHKIDKIDIEYSLDNGANWIPVESEVSAVADSFSWKVPFFHTTQGRVRIRNSDSSFISMSENPFSIVQSSIVLLSPKGGDTLEPGTVEDITWSATPGVDSVKVEYSPDDGTNWQFLAVSGASDPYHWTVPSAETTQGLIRVSWVEHSVVTSTVNGPFFIKSETPIQWTYYLSSPVKVLSVNGDNVWYVTETNILRLNRKTAVIDTIIPPKDFLLSQIVPPVFDSRGVAWFGTYDFYGALWSFNGTKWDKYPIQFLAGLGIDSNDIKYVMTKIGGMNGKYSLLNFNDGKTITSGTGGMIERFTSLLTVDNRRHSVWVGNENGPEEILIDTGQTGINGSSESLNELWPKWPQQGVLDTYGNFWFSSYTGYISTYTEGKWIHLSSDNSPFPWKSGSWANYGMWGVNME